MVKKSTKNITLILILLAGVASWAFYQLLNNGVKDLLLMVGVENFYLQNFIIIGVVFALFLLLGYGARKAFRRIVK